MNLSFQDEAGDGRIEQLCRSRPPTPGYCTAYQTVPGSWITMTPCMMVTSIFAMNPGSDIHPGNFTISLYVAHLPSFSRLGIGLSAALIPSSELYALRLQRDSASSESCVCHDEYALLGKKEIRALAGEENSQRYGKRN